MAGRLGVAEGGGEQALIIVDGQRDQPGVRRLGLSQSPAGGGAWASVRSRSWAAVTAQTARAAMTSTEVPQDRGVERGPGTGPGRSSPARARSSPPLAISARPP